jgi:potassium-transporting ATPase KdpC subunit
MLSEIRPALVSTVAFTLLLGLGYPLVVTGISELAFPYQADGSIVRDAAGHVVGSALIAQPFARDEYLHPRPSAAGNNGYDPTASGGSNYGPLSSDLAKRVAKDAASIRAADGTADLPDDAVTTSGSGLDPDISPAYAFDQAARVARARGVPVETVNQVIAAHVEGSFLGFIGQPHVNVLMTNRALDQAAPKGPPKPA